jgi:hypothetical protein
MTHKTCIVDDDGNTIFPDFFFQFLEKYVTYRRSMTDPNERMEGSEYQLVPPQFRADAQLLQKEQKWGGKQESFRVERISRVRSLARYGISTRILSRNPRSQSIKKCWLLYTLCNLY